MQAPWLKPSKRWTRIKSYFRNPGAVEVYGVGNNCENDAQMHEDKKASAGLVIGYLEVSVRCVPVAHLIFG